MELNPQALPFEPYTYTSSGVTWDGLGCDLAGHNETDIGLFSIPFKCDPVMAACLVTEGFAGGTTGEAEIRFDRRFTAGSNTGRTDGDIGRLILGQSGVSAAGEVAYDEACAGVSLEPGMEVVVEIIRKPTGAGEAGHIRPMLLVRYRPETKSNMAALQETV